METPELKWSKTQELQIVAQYRQTHLARCPIDGAILEIHQVGVFGNPDAIIARCPTCQRELNT